MSLAQRGHAITSTLVATTIAAALTMTANNAFATGNPLSDAAGRRAQAEAQHHTFNRAATRYEVETPTFSMTAVDKKSGNLYLYHPDGMGGFAPRYDVGVDFRHAAAVADVDNDKDGEFDGTWTFEKSGLLTYTWTQGDDSYTQSIGRGWQHYGKVLSPGDIGGAEEADLVAVDRAGVMWRYLGYADGTLTARSKVGGGWDQYTQIAGQGDLTGDGRSDIVARDRAGVLWLYKGTGDQKAPFAQRTRIGGGWNAYNRILSVGDLDGDGRSDLVARADNGDLYRYSGNGNCSDPFDNRTKIGWGYNIYNLI
ncbi:FG-GAP repeat domain-containing protein [Streptomyces melanogenes]|uniref:FG-GAP repeat domain-containing protein n=1 Tax=Streptomyces melanogenes TaxID=67326 RepID=UPI00167D7E37|nr:VCBS repeat-containing protein [Streptomyces melanogenes]GGP90628.1 hypothetical protein GCM10010278_81200 [Streptomyces melanogenes]